MNIRQFTSDECEAWDAYAAQEPSFSLLQSWDWGRFKQAMGRIVYRIGVEEQGRLRAGAQLLIKPLPAKIASVAYIPRGPIGDWSDSETASYLWEEIHRLSRLHKAAFLTIEPQLPSGDKSDQRLRLSGFKPSQYTIQPRSTIVVDISRSEEEILAQMRKKTRQYIHSAVREGITVRRGNLEDLSAYCALMQMTGNREKFAVRSREYYEQEWKTLSQNNRCILLMAYLGNQLLAVRTAYCFGKHAAEFHAGSVEVQANLHPNYLLVWEAMKWAKSQGCVSYDMWGIPNEIDVDASSQEAPVSNRTDGLWGVYRFKSGFSKNIVSYAGAYDYVYQPQLFALLSNGIMRGDSPERIMAWIESIRHR